MPILEAVYWAVRVRKPVLIHEWDADERCYLCQRRFGEKYDPKDASEIACSPLRRSCGHLVSSECWNQFFDQDFEISECPYLAHYDGPDTVLLWVKLLCEYIDWNEIEGFTHSMILRAPWFDQRLSRLHMRAYLDLQPLGIWSRSELWAYYYVGAVLHLARAGLFVLALIFIPCGGFCLLAIAVKWALVDALRLRLEQGMIAPEACATLLIIMFFVTGWRILREQL